MKNSKPEISVIMSSYNNEETILDAINSILVQSYKNIELVVVNDGSIDATENKLTNVSDSRLVIIKNKNNIGLTRSLNKALSIAKGRFIARQDADDVSMPERLEKQYQYMLSNPEVAFLGTGRLTLSSTGAPLSTKLLPQRPGYGELLKNNCFVHGSVMIRREVLDQVGHYNETFKYTQDYELWLRIFQRFKGQNLQEALYGVRRHFKRATVSNHNQAQLFRALAINLYKYGVEQQILDEIKASGINSYYRHLSKEEKMKHHKRCILRFTRYGLNDEADKHFVMLGKMTPWAFFFKLYSTYIARTQFASDPGAVDSRTGLT